MKRLMVALMGLSMLVQINAADVGAGAPAGRCARVRAAVTSRRVCMLTAVLAACTVGVGVLEARDAARIAAAAREVEIEQEAAWRAAFHDDHGCDEFGIRMNSEIDDLIGCAERSSLYCLPSASKFKKDDTLRNAVAAPAAYQAWVAAHPADYPGYEFKVVSDFYRSVDRALVDVARAKDLVRGFEFEYNSGSNTSRAVRALVANMHDAYHAVRKIKNKLEKQYLPGAHEIAKDLKKYGSFDRVITEIVAEGNNCGFGTGTCFDAAVCEPVLRVAMKKVQSLEHMHTEMVAVEKGLEAKLFCLEHEHAAITGKNVCTGVSFDYGFDRHDYARSLEQAADVMHMQRKRYANEPTCRRRK